MDNLYKGFGAALTNLRKQDDLSGSELGYILGVSRVTVNNWEAGKAKPVGHHLMNILVLYPALKAFFTSEAVYERAADLKRRKAERKRLEETIARFNDAVKALDLPKS